MEVFTGCSNRSIDSEHHSKKMGVVRSRFEKNAIRVCGDWSEQLSSKGKIYFYNCITEVSQWQKPSDWTLPDLEHNELIKLLSQRDSLEISVMKRPRLMCNAGASIRKDDVDVNRISPKRSKTYEHADSEKRYLTDDRVCLQRNVCGYIPKNRPPLRQRGYRESPKIDCNGSSHCTTQYSSHSHGKRDPPIPIQRSIPTDDMEISPSSSPMSGGSSPLAYGSSRSPRRVKCRPGTGPRVLRRPACSVTKNPSRDTTDKSGNSHTLRQLIDAIRDSIGGLLDQSPCSTSNQKIKASVSANGLHSDEVPNSGEKVSSSSVNSSVHTCRTVNQAGKAQPVRSATDPSSEFHDGSYVHSPGNCFTQPEASTNPSSSERLNVQNKGMSGLVSTLSTLVTLIGTRNSNSRSVGGDGCSAHTPTQTLALRQSFTKPQLLQQPLQHRFGHQMMSSPLTPSPVTPSAATGASSGGGSCGGTLTNSISSASTFNSVQQPDDAVSGPDRVGPAKFPVSASTSSHDLNSQCNIQRSVSPSRPGGLEIRDDHRLVSESIPTDELSSECQKSIVEPITTMDYSQTDKELRTRMSASRYLPAGSASPAISSTGRQSTGPTRLYSPTTPQSALHKTSLITGLDNSGTFHPRDSVGAFVDKRYERQTSPDKLYPSLDAVETQAYVEPGLNLQYRDVAAERLEIEAQTEAKRFDRLHSVLYGELSAESKILRALVRISEAKLALHKEKQSSLQDLMDTIECHRQLPNPSLPDDAI